MTNLGVRVSYLALADGTPVYTPDTAFVGVVQHVVADDRQDIFHGVIVRLPRDHHGRCFAYREQIAELYERGVVLSVPAGQLHDLREDLPAEQVEESGDPVRLGLRRAWEWLIQPR